MEERRRAYRRYDDGACPLNHDQAQEVITTLKELVKVTVAADKQVALFIKDQEFLKKEILDLKQKQIEFCKNQQCIIDQLKTYKIFIASLLLVLGGVVYMLEHSGSIIETAREIIIEHDA